MRSLRNLIYTVGYHHNLDLQKIRDLQIAITELTANIIQHTYRRQKNQVIQYKFSVDDDHFTCVIRDYGPRVSLETFQARELNDYRESGLGLFIVRNIVTSLSYDRSVSQGTRTVIKVLLE